MRPPRWPIRRRARRPRPAAARRVVCFVVIALALFGTVGAPAPAAQAAPPSGPSAPAEAPRRVEAFAPYVGQSICDPTAKPGTTALAEAVLTYYGTGRDGGTTRDCSIGGRSEHKEGRAWDWMVAASDPVEKAVAEEFLAWLLADGPRGEDAYNARRLGVMYVIWNQRIWSSYYASSGWREYSGPSPHTDHIHISLSWSGAMGRTSWWTGVRADVTTGPP